MLTVCLPYMYIDEAVEFTSVCVRVWTITDNQDPLEFTQQSLKMQKQSHWFDQGVEFAIAKLLDET